MLFSSISFLYYFLACLIIIYFVMPKTKWKNLILLVMSLCFYGYGEPRAIWILLLSCVISYVGGRLIEKSTKYRTWILVITIGIELSFLIYYKYAGFFLDTLRSLSVPVPFFSVVMPIGISFFTFQTISYVADVYQKKVEASCHFWQYATYVCLFPQLVAGPIVRYSEVEKELQSREHSYELFANGIRRFVIGLAKKVLLANVLGEFCTILSGQDASVLSYWLQAISYALQIYFDFSGYSDMAIGLGAMFGFRFPENFNYPFIARSITEFWRRWHMTLSYWFRDYVYIPLGGNRVSFWKWVRNVMVVWLLTGFWHGANWNFLFWGLYFGILLLLEKKIWGKYLEDHHALAWVYTQLLVVISFVIFRQEDLSLLVQQLQGMFGAVPLINATTLYYFKSYFVILVIGIFAMTPWVKQLSQWVKTRNRVVYDVLDVVIIIGLFLIVTAYLVDASFNPFLYFRF